MWACGFVTSIFRQRTRKRVGNAPFLFFVWGLGDLRGRLCQGRVTIVS